MKPLGPLGPTQSPLQKLHEFAARGLCPRPSQEEDERRAAVEMVEVVTEARLGNRGEHFLQVVEEVDPDVIALGYDQRAPAGLAEAFPKCEIVTMKPHCPEKYKSSYFRKVGEP